MSNTLVIQSHRTPLPYHWLSLCLESVREWSALNGYGYRFVDDQLFAPLPAALLAKTGEQRVIASDLARLRWLQAALDEGYETVVWLDADFLVFDPKRMVLPDTPYAVGREVWVQQDTRGWMRVYNKVHNAFLMFRRGNTFLDFYGETAQRLLEQNSGTMPPQFIGPKLLTALHNIAQLPVMEGAAMFSPMVIRDLLRGEGAALSLFQTHSPCMPGGANLCTSSCMREEITPDEMTRVIALLRQKGMSSFAIESPEC